MKTVQIYPKQSEKTLAEWFENTISNLKVDQIMLETDTAPTAKKHVYSVLMNGDMDKMHYLARNSSSEYFIGNLLIKYIDELCAFKSLPIDLAFDLSDAKILVWAKIKDDDENTEDALLLAEAKANAAFSNHGFFISSTIVEESDLLEVPPHYKPVRLD